MYIYNIDNLSPYEGKEKYWKQYKHIKKGANKCFDNLSPYEGKEKYWKQYRHIKKGANNYIDNLSTRMPYSAHGKSH